MEEQKVERYEEGSFLNICVSPDVWLNHVGELSVSGFYCSLLSIIDLGVLQQRLFFFLKVLFQSV